MKKKMNKIFLFSKKTGNMLSHNTHESHTVLCGKFWDMVQLFDGP